jgi:DNA-binding XRE family transcriptional regulator
MSSGVYLLRAERGPYPPGEWLCKIGRSEDAERRASALASDFPFALRLVRVIPTPDPGWLEAALHLVFARRRLRREWFRLSDGDVAAFLAVPDGAGGPADLPPPAASGWALRAASIGLRAARLALRRRQEDLARLIGVSQSVISAYERGLCRPSHENVMKLAADLRCRPDDLFPGAVA